MVIPKDGPEYAQLNNMLYFYQAKLGLLDWKIWINPVTREYFAKEGVNALASITVHFERKTARIDIIPESILPDDYISEVAPRENIQHTLVHELIHLFFMDWWDEWNASLSEALSKNAFADMRFDFDRMQERACNLVAAALVDLARPFNPEQTSPEQKVATPFR
jgi:Zn-dependent peptidase ImmA (M78 family)